MKVNRNTVLVGQKVVLLPYRKQHVLRYHEWMKDPLIQQQTASEPLSLEQEYQMQQSWAVDEDKLTFIILAKTSEPSSSEADVDKLVSECKMVGDVNLFFNARHEDEDEEDEAQSATANGEQATEPKSAILDAECEIMIAGESHLEVRPSQFA